MFMRITSAGTRERLTPAARRTVALLKCTERASFNLARNHSDSRQLK
jgi:hypothetical protein